MKTIHIVVFGIGNVGSTLINQIHAAKETLKVQKGIDLQIPIVTNSRLVFLSKEGVGTSWESDFDKFSVPFKVEDVVKYVKEKNYEHLIAIDATASKEFVQNYIPLIENGFHIVSANKIANTLSYDFYKELRQVLKNRERTFLYETNVGAALPVIETIQNLYHSGEKINKIRGVFSGSLSYMFNSFSSETISFSKILKEASDLGLTEPDAREDLSGNDVARKLLILARELDLKVEFSDVSVQSLVPKRLNGKTTLSQFKARAMELDEPLQILKDEQIENHVLRYVGELDVNTNKLEVKLISADKNSSLGQLQGSDSIFEIYSDSYKEYPLVIRGAGAGKEITARGLFSDILKLAKNLN